jgi:molybdate transport system substrate-binding protein
MTFRSFFLFSFTLICLSGHQTLSAGEVRVATAANFTATMKVLKKAFEHDTDHKVKISYGSTGKLYTQILHRAPFDIFLSADKKHPKMLMEKNLAEEPFTYAIGKLVLWTGNPDIKIADTTLKEGNFKRLAIANPKTAPYGMAAIKIMKQLGLYETIKSKLIYGDNIAQTYQFVSTRNVDLGFVALAQIALDNSGSSWVVPQALYDPIHQDAVLLNRGKENPAAIALLEYLKSDSAAEVIQQFGYATQ